jgi:hypothetical protein
MGALPRRADVHAVILGSEERQPLINEDIPLPFGMPAALPEILPVSGIAASGGE